MNKRKEYFLNKNLPIVTSVGLVEHDGNFAAFIQHTQGDIVLKRKLCEANTLPIALADAKVLFVRAFYNREDNLL